MRDRGEVENHNSKYVISTYAKYFSVLWIPKMAKEVGRTLSYSTIKDKRRLEVFGFILSAILVMVLAVSFIAYKRSAPTLLGPCTSSSSQHMKDITEEREGNGSVHAKDGMVYPPGFYWTSQNGSTWGCPCLLKPCLYKCCQEEETHIFTDYTSYDYTEKLASCTAHNGSFRPNNRKIYSARNLTHLQKVTVDDDHFFVISGGGCKGRGMYALEEEENENAFLLDDGMIFRINSKKPLWNFTEFCVESSNESTAIHFMVCFEEETNEVREDVVNEWMYYVRGAGMVVSVPCLFATLFVYALLPQLKNLHGKSLMSHVTSLTIAYSCLALTLISDSLPQIVCKGLGFVIQFSVLASFFWLNIMCFDIWWVFSGLMPLRGSQKDAEQLKFLLYSLYAWGCPLLLLLITLFMEFAPGLPAAVVRPEMGVTRCFFKEADGRLLYLYLPIGILVYLNIAMFLTTALRFKSHSKSVKKLQRGDSRRHCQAGRSTSDMQRFSLYLKLSVVMGVNWVLELLSFFLGSSATVWLVVDLANALQGVFIFYMFVCKRPILRQVNQRLCPGLEIISHEPSVKTVSSARSNSSGKITLVQCKVSNGVEYQCTLTGGESTA